jgi:Sulfotransferase domain
MKSNVNYFVVSLPRSGTSSITKMAEICGLRVKHCPHNYFEHYFNKNQFDFYSDTPIFVPSEIENICKKEDIEVKFIFIDRPFSEIFDSWGRVNLYDNYKKMFKDWTEDKESMSIGRLYDFESYNKSFQNIFCDENNYNEVFQRHKESVISIIKEYGKELLIYNFEYGWKPFCDFLEVEIPSEEIPILNKNNINK